MTRHIHAAAAVTLILLPLFAAGSSPESTGPFCEQGFPGYVSPADLSRDWSHPISFSAVVEEVTLVRTPAESRPSVRLLVTMDEGLLEVHLGPAWFLAANWMVLEPGDAIELTGRVMEMVDDEIFVAVSISVGEESLNLRTVEGLPLWGEEPAPRPEDPS